MEKRIRKAAQEWARETTSARCHETEMCWECGVRFCDYRSRCEAFEAGCMHLVKTLSKMPWDEALHAIGKLGPKAQGHD